MSYEVHITRSAFWAETQGVEIRETEWLDVVRTEGSLSYRGHGITVGEGLRSDREDAMFIWHDGIVSTEDPDEETLNLMRNLAARLDAMVQGDDGEEY